MFDLTGKQILHQTSRIPDLNGVIDLDVYTLNNGLYILRISSSSQVFSAKIIVN
jgi:hypothetical protein